MRQKRFCTASGGFNVLYTIGVILVGLTISAVGVDMGFYFSAQNQLQTTADAAALAATRELYLGSGSDVATRMQDAITDAQDLVFDNLGTDALLEDDVIYGFIDPSDKIYDPETFATPSADSDYELTNGYNAVRVTVRRDGSTSQLPTIFANMVGIANMDASASSVALIDNTISSITDGGIRPIYACQGQFDAAAADGNLENNVIRIYGKGYAVDGNTSVAGCPALGSGNWGFADLRDCSPGAVGMPLLSSWFEHGYPGTVSTGECYSTQPGNGINSGPVSGALNKIVGKQILVPLIDTFNGSGSNTQVEVSAFAGFVITGYQANGNNSWIEGYFTTALCKKGCTSDGGNGPTGGSVVKLRLANRS